MIEYKVINIAGSKTIEADLNRLAIDKWRVVCSFGKKARHIILKRKLNLEE